MLPLVMQNSAYELHAELYRSPRTLVYDAVRRSDGKRVAVKTNAADYPSALDLSRLRREFYLLRRLDVPGAVKVHALESWGARLALIEEYQDGEALSARARSGPLPIGELLELAEAVSRVVVQLHERLVHLDLAPENIFWHAEQASACVIDFSRAVPLEAQHGFAAESCAESSLPYVAPERSGRMSRRVDARADLYSVGAVLYELATGRPMFDAATRAEWFFCHTARQPAPPHRVNPDVPEVVSSIILRLLDKNPDQRYQSAAALLRDLRECRQRWVSSGTVEPFALSRRVARSSLRSPSRIHSREHEVAALLDAYDSVRSGDTCAAIVSGDAGVGKSALVEHMRTIITRLDGYFVSGKADQFGVARPYAALVQAFREITTHLLAEPEERLKSWAEQLNAALSPNAHLLVEMVPELERVIGPQVKPPTGNPVEEQNRFQNAITAFLHTFAKPSHPLVLFLDDLQWSDPDSLGLVERLLADPDVTSFLFIGAHRGDAAILPHLDARLQKRARASVRRLRLEPLGAGAAFELLADMLEQANAETEQLARRIHASTQGNPLHFIEVVRLLRHDGQLHFDARSDRWAWNLAQIRLASDAQKLPDVIRQRFQNLSSATRNCLQLAACIGSSFRLDVLAMVSNQSIEDIYSQLMEATEHGFVAGAEAADGASAQSGASFGNTERLRFLHDGLQQAAHAELSEQARQQAHHRIGRLLLQHCSPVEREERSIEIAHQLNEGRSLIESDGERAELLQLNLSAARKATQYSAHESAFGLLEVAHSLLPPAAFEHSFSVAFEVHYRYAAAAYLVQHFDVARQACAEILKRARSPLERARVHAMQLVQLTFCGRMDDAIDAGLRALSTLGIRLTARPSRWAILRDLALVSWRLWRRPIASVEHQEVLSDERARLCMKVLIDFIPSSYLTGNERLFAASVLKQVNLSLIFGNGPESASAYASYTVLLAGLGRLKRADEFGRLALRLLERYAASDTRCRNYLLYALFAHSWTRPWNELRRWFQDAVRAGLESGDHLFTAYGCGWVYLWDPEVDIETAHAESASYLSIIERTDYQNAHDAALLARQFWRNLLGQTSSRVSLGDAEFDEEACVQRMRSAQNQSGLGIHALYSLVLAVLYERWEAAFGLVEASKPLIRALAGSPYMVEYSLHAFLACISVRDPRVRRRARRVARRLRAQILEWAAYSPENFGVLGLLVDAEWARVSSARVAATRLYHAATAASYASLGARYEALANERAALFFCEEKLERLAAPHLAAAQYHYARWGAVAKVRFLEEQYPRLIELARGEQAVVHAARASSSLGMATRGGEDGDSVVIDRVCGLLSAELPLDGLFAQLLYVLQQAFGGTRSVLLLRDDETGQLISRAELSAEREAGERGAELLDPSRLPASVLRYAVRSGKPVLIERTLRGHGFTKDEYLHRSGVRSLLAVPMMHRGQAVGALYFEHRTAPQAFDSRASALAQTIGAQVAIAIQNTQLDERLKRMTDSFSRVVPKEFLSNLGRKSFSEIRPGESITKAMTVLFCDLRGFTTLSERLGPSSSIELVNTYLSRMETPILANGGFVDSYSGDGILALFDAGPEHAVRAAIAMLREMSDLNELRDAQGAERLTIGIGVNSGQLTLGAIGGAQRFKYGVVGDTVNLAARIEGLTKYYGVPLLISGETWLALEPGMRAWTRPLGRARVVGRSEPVELFEVFGADEPHILQRKQQLSSDWRQALELFGARQFVAASEAFRGVRNSLDQDRPAALFEERARRLASAPPASGWTAVEEILEK